MRLTSCKWVLKYVHLAARRYLDLGFHISLSGVVTYKKTEALQDAVRFAPLDRLMALPGRVRLTVANRLVQPPHTHDGRPTVPGTAAQPYLSRHGRRRRRGVRSVRSVRAGSRVPRIFARVARCVLCVVHPASSSASP